MKEIYIVIIIVFICLFILAIISHKKIDITTFNIKNKKIDKDIKIVFLSDLHNRNLLFKLTQIINNIKPDIIICGGDMINEDISKTNNFLSLTKIFDNYKTYYSFGNHEEVLDDDELEKYIKIINGTKIILLNNKNISLSKNIELYGFVNDINTYKKFNKTIVDKDYIENKIGVLDTKKYNIMIAHNPLEFDSYVDYKPDLVLSGHVHGGIIKIPFLGALLSPEFKFFPKYYEGKHKKNNTLMIVSRGLGFSERIPFRINNPAEVVVINLQRSKE